MTAVCATLTRKRPRDRDERPGGHGKESDLHAGRRLQSDPAGRRFHKGASMTGHTKILSVTPFRRVACRREQRIQAWLDSLHGMSEYPLTGELEKHGYPSWMRGVRVEKAGRLSFAVVATDTRGH